MRSSVKTFEFQLSKIKSCEGSYTFQAPEEQKKHILLFYLFLFWLDHSLLNLLHLSIWLICYFCESGIQKRQCWERQLSRRHRRYSTSMVLHKSKQLGSIWQIRIHTMVNGLVCIWNKYRKVASSRLSLLVAHLQIFRLFMKGKFDTYVKSSKLNSRPVYCSRLYGRHADQ